MLARRTPSGWWSLDRTSPAPTATDKESNCITISATAVVLNLLGFAFLLAAISFGQDIVVYLDSGYTLDDKVWRFDLDAERSVPTWYSSLLLVLCSLLLLSIARIKLTRGEHNALRWLALAAIFLALSVDESVSFHEWLSAYLARTFHLSGVFHFAWVAPALVLVAIGAVAYLPFVLEFTGARRALLVASAVVYLAGAVGLEMVAGVHVEAFGIDSLYYRGLATVEELLEMVGLIAFLGVLLAFARDAYGALHLHLDR